MPTTETLTLLQGDCEGGCEPDKNPWKPEGQKDVRIHNKSGSKQVLSNIRGSCLKTKNGKNEDTITLEPDEIWKGKAGKKAKKGTYIYDDGCPTEGPRTGHIDPS